MKHNIRIESELTARPDRGGEARRHRLPRCQSTGLARYRDRHQARQGGAARSAGEHNFKVATFACPDCRGYHLEQTYTAFFAGAGDVAEPTTAFTASLSTRPRRYVLFDVENPTRGAKASVEELANLWRIVKSQAPGFTAQDHIVIGASRSVVGKYRGVIGAPNVSWVVGANAPDGADRALLGAIDLRRVARDYDELVIISGDHAFAPLARRAKRLGLRVHVVTAEAPGQHSMLSRDLAAAADLRTLVRHSPRKPKLAGVTPISAGGLMHRRVHLATAAA